MLGVDRHQLDFIARAKDAVHLLQAGGLAADAHAVVDQLGVDRALGDIDKTHSLVSLVLTPISIGIELLPASPPPKAVVAARLRQQGVPAAAGR